MNDREELRQLRQDLDSLTKIMASLHEGVVAVASMAASLNENAINLKSGHAAPAGGNGWGQARQDIMKGASGDPLGALMDATKQEIDNFKRGLAKTMGHLAAGATSRSVFQAAGHGFRAAGASADMFDQTGATGGTLKFVGAITESIDKIRQFSDDLKQTGFQFAEMSAAMSAVKTEEEIRKMFLAQERGNRLAGSTRELAEARAPIERAEARLQDVWTGLKDSAGAWLSKNVQAPVEIGGINALLGDDKKPIVESGVPEWAKEATKESWFQTYGLPKRFKDKGATMIRAADREPFTGGIVHQPKHVVWQYVREKWFAFGSADTLAEAWAICDRAGPDARILPPGQVPEGRPGDMVKLS